MKNLKIYSRAKRQFAVLGVLSTSFLGGCTLIEPEHIEKQKPVQIMMEAESNNTFDDVISRKKLQKQGLDFLFIYKEYDKTSNFKESNRYQYGEHISKKYSGSYLYECSTDERKIEISSLSFVKYRKNDNGNGEILLGGDEWVEVPESDIVVNMKMLLNNDNSKSAVVKYENPLMYSNSIREDDIDRLTEIKVFDNIAKLEYGHTYMEITTPNGIELIDSEEFDRSSTISNPEEKSR